MVKKNPRTTRRELMEEISSIGVNVTRPTVTNTLGSEGLRKYQARRIHLLKKSHLETRKKFAADILKKEDSYLDKILWLDETKMELFGNNYSSKVWLEPGPAYNRNNALQQWTTEEVALWYEAIFLHLALENSMYSKERMNCQKYCEILDKCLCSSVRILGLGRSWTFQQGNDPNHTSIQTTEWFRTHRIKCPWVAEQITRLKSYWKSLEAIENKGRSKAPIKPEGIMHWEIGKKKQLIYPTVSCYPTRDNWKQFWSTKDMLLNIRAIFHICIEHFFASHLRYYSSLLRELDHLMLFFVWKMLWTLVPNIFMTFSCP